MSSFLDNGFIKGIRSWIDLCLALGKIRLDRPIANWRTAWRRICKAAGLPRLRFHDLRHTATTKLLENAVPYATVAQILDGPRRLPYGWRGDTVTSALKLSGGPLMPLRQSVFQKVCTKMITKLPV
jgi:Phage integrase family